MRLFMDVECYPNYFLAMFMSEKGKTQYFEKYDDEAHGKFDRKGMSRLLAHPDVELVTFNGISYDVPMCMLALSGARNEELKRASDTIIEESMPPWKVYRHFDIDEPFLNHIDLIQVAPGQVSLKLYGGRLHYPNLQDLPYDPNDILVPEQIVEVIRYCRKDVGLTRELYRFLEKQIDLRRTMGEQYGVDLRSRSDAQIAEEVLKAEYTRMKGAVPDKVTVRTKQFQYKPPGYVRFVTDQMKQHLDTICKATMVVKNTGHVQIPKEIASMKINIGGVDYKLGIGGLHSQESSVSYKSNGTHVLIDRDVKSYYPNLMLNMDIKVPAFGDTFVPVYRDILERRFAAKAEGKKEVDASLKIVLNGTFGKTSNKYSALYSPTMMIRTTLTGQLSLLMLIEMLDLLSIPVLSANTDGVVIRCPRDREHILNLAVAKWEKLTNLETEETRYKALYSRDVNNYIAITEDGKVKAKGVYAESEYGNPGLSKNPQNEICSLAVIRFLKDGVPINQTLRECRDIRKFITLRTVNGGAIKDDKYVGKVVRWYYAKGEDGVITYKTNGNKVPRSRGAKLIMDLPEEFPEDVDYKWYAKECVEILMAIGAVPRPEVPKIPRKNSKAWKALVEAGEIVENDEGKWEWV